MTKLLKHSVLAVALTLGSSSYAHAESIALAHGGFGEVIEELVEWLFGSSSADNNSSNNPGNKNPSKNVAPEVDPSLAMSGFLLLGGTLTVLRSRRSRRPVTN
jgi:hypothetical protein